MSQLNITDSHEVKQNYSNIRVTDDLERLLGILPENIADALLNLSDMDNLVEVVMDLGRRPEARFPHRVMKYLKDDFITLEEIQYVVQRVGKFGKDHRAGIERTLHRISAITNRSNEIIGLTLRVGRAVYGTISLIADLIASDKSILLLGRPGVGKTTMLREMARVLADDFQKRVVIVDTSNEIAGDGDIPHSGIGLARRMQVPSPELQHEVMIEAVENHMPEVIVVDEIGTEKEAYAARTIAERGVQLVATAHGNTLENLLLNPTLSDLVGGIQAVTLSDEEARKRRTQKTVLERKAPPTFDIVIEIQGKDQLAIHPDVQKVIDSMLRGVEPHPEIRVRNQNGGYRIIQEADTRTKESTFSNGRNGLYPHKEREKENTTPSPPKPFSPIKGKTVKIFPYAVSRNRLEKSIEAMKVHAVVVRRWEDADVILTLKSQDTRGTRQLRELAGNTIPFHIIRSNTVTQMENFIREFFRLPSSPPEDPQEKAIMEAEQAAMKVLETEETLELSPQNSYIRRLQHQIIDKYNLSSYSVGKDPHRRVIIENPR